MNERDGLRRRRAELLLRLGSPGEGDAPKAGFEERVRERIAAGTTPVALSWADSLGSVARPALAMAAIVTIATVAVHLWDRARGDELILLADDDAAMGTLLDGNLDDVIEEGLP